MRSSRPPLRFPHADLKESSRELYRILRPGSHAPSTKDRRQIQWRFSVADRIGFGKDAISRASTRFERARADGRHGLLRVPGADDDDDLPF